MSVTTILRHRRALRWSVPACVAGIVALASAGVFTARASSERLPAKSAEALLADVQSARVSGLSGTIVARTSLGLPSLPNIGANQGQASLPGLLSGSHTMRFWYDGPQRQRLALLGTTNETDLFHNGLDVWQWDSDGHTATHTVLPAGHPSRAQSIDLTPQQFAERAIKAITPTTAVTVAANRRVADRTSYDLVLTPHDKATLVGSVRIAIDGKTKMPLAVQVFSRNSSTPAIDVAYSHVSFKTPAADNFAFTPPPGATVRQSSAADHPAEPRSRTAPGTLTTIGSGWTAIIEYRATPQQIAKVAGPMLGRLKAVHGGWGHGRLLTSALLSVLVTDDGRVFAGAVDASDLYTAAASHK